MALRSGRSGLSARPGCHAGRASCASGRSGAVPPGLACHSGTWLLVRRPAPRRRAIRQRPPSSRRSHPDDSPQRIAVAAPRGTRHPAHPPVGPGVAVAAIASLAGAPAALVGPLPRPAEPSPTRSRRRPRRPPGGRPPPAMGRHHHRGRHGRPVRRHHPHHAGAGTQAPRPPHPGRRARRANPPSHGRTPDRAGRDPQQPPAPGRPRHTPGRQPVKDQRRGGSRRGEPERLPHGVTIGHLAHRSAHPPSPGRRTAGCVTWPAPQAGIETW